MTVDQSASSSVGQQPASAASGSTLIKPKRRMNLKLNMSEINSNVNEAKSAMAAQSNTSQVEGTQAFSNKVDLCKLDPAMRTNILL